MEKINVEKKRIRITKKEAKEFFRKVFGSCPSDIYQDAAGRTWFAEYGTLTASCCIKDSGHLQLGTIIGTYPIGFVYYHPETYEIDHEYTMEEQREAQRDNALEYMEAHNLLVR